MLNRCPKLWTLCYHQQDPKLVSCCTITVRIQLHYCSWSCLVVRKDSNLNLHLWSSFYCPSWTLSRSCLHGRLLPRQDWRMRDQRLSLSCNQWLWSRTRCWPFQLHFMCYYSLCRSQQRRARIPLAPGLKEHCRFQKLKLALLDYYQTSSNLAG